MRKRTISLAAVMFCFALAGSATAATYSFEYTGGTPSIIDYTSDYVEIEVPDGLGTISDVNVFVNISHTWINDVELYLWHSEDGGDTWKGVQLYNHDAAGGYDNIPGVLFDDQAPTSISNAALPYVSGVFRPTALPADGESNLLSDFIGDQSAGLWDLEWYDWANGDTGTLLNFRIDFETTSHPVPLPGAVLLFGSGLGAVAGLRRLRQK